MRQKLAILVGLVVLLALSGRAFAHYNVYNGDIYDNTMHGHEHGDEFHGHAGNDTGYGRGFVDSLGGGHDNDYLYGDSSGDFVSGGDGDDYVHGGGQNDHVEGDAGDDSVLAGAWYDNVIQGGPGPDYVDSYDASYQELARGGTGNLDWCFINVLDEPEGCERILAYGQPASCEPHDFEVRAIDPAGNVDATAAWTSWCSPYG
jgi:hypothetical protein